MPSESQPRTRGELIPIFWEGDSLDVLRAFPEGVREDFGYALYRLQRGERPLRSRRMDSIGPGVFELKESDERGWYRLVYLSKFAGCIYVLHCFEKTSRKTERRDLEIAKARLKQLRARLREREL